MPGPRIATTQRDGLRPLGIHGQPVVESHAQIVRYLREALSPAHADLFAEPNPEVRPGEIEWYATPEGEAIRREALAPEAREALDAELKRLVDEIAARADLLRQSKEGGEQLLGELLALALRIPGDSYIYAIGRQPVLAGWGHVVDDPAADHTVLQKLVTAPPRPPVPPAAVVAPRPTMWPWWLALLLLLIGAGFLLPFLAAPLLAQLARPDSGFCAIPPEQRLMIATIDSEQSEEASLRRELVFVEAQIAEKAALCRAPAQSARRTPDPAPFPRLAEPPRSGLPPAGPGTGPGIGSDDRGGSDRRDPDAPGADVPRADAPPDRPEQRGDRPDTPRPDAAPEQRADRPDARTDPPVPERRATDRGQTSPPQTNPPRPEDMRPRLDREHAQQGEASVSLAWNTQDDLDVVVVCPGNAEVGYRQPQGCGGQLDVDMNRGDPRSDTPVENITWPSVDAAPRGRYRVQIDNQSNQSVPYRVRVTVRGESREYTGTAPPHARGHRVGEFDLPGQAPAAPARGATPGAAAPGGSGQGGTPAR
ncbi:MAG: hypothetical protein JNL66_17970 [Alphaproteobacteria bacterium]|nr:hypothetical protein [Alphaproteobacteria bacterium]